jgi:hypothetical protein
MKTNLVTSIGIGVVGAVLGFFICNLLLGPIEQVSFKSIESDVSADLAEPNVDVFNYKALNPTVEVFVGNCENNEGCE